MDSFYPLYEKKTIPVANILFCFLIEWKNKLHFAQETLKNTPFYFCAMMGMAM